MRSNPLLEGLRTVQGAGRTGRRSGLRLLMHIDGASRGNPGPAGIGVMLEAGDGSLPQTFCRYLGETTNNVAEYEALLLALREARKLQPAVVRILSDSELLVRQVQGKYRVRNPRLAALYAQALDLIQQLSAADCRLSIEHIARELNSRADALANRAIDEALFGVAGEKARSWSVPGEG